jgi:ketosteroid isomerase-like protein
VPVVSASAAPAESATPPAPPTPPLPELEKTSLESAARTMNQHDARAYAALFTTRAVHKEAAAPDLNGRDAIASRMQLLFRSFSDFTISVDRALVKDNVVVTEWHWSGTDSGGYLGKRPTGRRAGISGVSVAFFNYDGLVREIHFYEDGENVSQQLDAAAAKGSFRAMSEASSGVTPTIVTSTNGPAEAKNLATSKAFYESIEKNDAAALGAFFTDDATVEDMALPSKGQKGKAAFSTIQKSWKNALGNFTQLPLYGQFAVNDWVVTERVMKAPPPANGSGQQLHCVDLSQWKDGKMTRFQTYSNTLELIAEVGPRGKRK